MHVRETSTGLTYSPDVFPTDNSADFRFTFPGSVIAHVSATLSVVTPQQCPLINLSVTMTSPKDGDNYFTCPGNGDFVLHEQETHTPISGNCVPSISWKEDLMDAGSGGQWHAAQEIHTAPLMPQNHPTDSRTLVVQVKAENSEHFATIRRATITLYKAQDRPIEEYRTLIDAEATAAANDVGVDVETFKTYVKAQLCSESNWEGYFSYCNPKFGENKNKRGQVWSRDWGIAAINDFYWTPKDTIADPRGGVLFDKIDDYRRKYDPFYGIRFQAKLLSRFFLLMRSEEFNGLTLTQKFQNAMCMYNGGENDGGTLVNRSYYIRAYVQKPRTRSPCC